MAISRKAEVRALNLEQRILVDSSHHPALQELADAELSNLVKLAREQRDKAQTEANRRRREMRGKADPKGAAVSSRDDGSQLKVAVLAMTMRRLNAEMERRRRLLGNLTLVENQGNHQKAEFNSRHAHKGMRTAVESLVRPIERGRQRAAAKRDGSK